MFNPKSWTAALLAVSLSYAGSVHAAQGVLIGTSEVAAAQGAVSVDATAAARRAHVLSYLDRPEVAAGLQERGVSADQARARVAALTDAEVDQLAQTLDNAPAGASGVVGALVLIFVLLLVTDILGLTKVFPFTRSAR